MPYNQARPKRAAETFARTHHDHEFDGQPSKKPRFDIRNPSALAPDATEDDATLEADVIGRRGQQVRRQAVNLDGYDSDSDNENFDARASTKAKQEKKAARSKDEDDNDMFADLEEDIRDGDDSEGDDHRRGGNRKAVRFLDEDEIEGQVQTSKSGGHVSADFSLGAKGKAKVTAEQDSSSESEVDDETRASTGDLDTELGAGSKKLHAPKLDAFNMKSENEEGRFDDQGNYVRKAADPDAVHDNWLEGVSKKDMRKAKEAHEKREHDRRERDLQDDAQPTGDILRRLIPQLKQGETVLEALARLGNKKSKKSKWQKKNQKETLRQNESADDVHMSEVDPAEIKRKEAIESITSAADMLLTRGQTEIYDTERELLTRQYRQETGDEWADVVTYNEEVGKAISDKLWEYRWSDARDGGDIHGPYDSTTMTQWNDAGYFGDGVEFHEKGSQESWSRVANFL